MRNVLSGGNLLQALLITSGDDDFADETHRSATLTILYRESDPRRNVATKLGRSVLGV